MPRMTYEHLQRQIQKLQAQAKKLEASRDSKKNKAVSQVTALMKKLGITVEDLPKTNAKPAKSGQNRKVKQSPKTRGPVAPKYRSRNRSNLDWSRQTASMAFSATGTGAQQRGVPAEQPK